MTQSLCRIFPSEYGYEYRGKSQQRVPLFYPHDCLGNRIEEWEIDPKETLKLDSFHQSNYKYPWTCNIDNDYEVLKASKVEATATRDSKNIKEKDFSNQLLENIQQLYYTPHPEKILAPPVTAKRIIGYIRPKLLHATFSTYQDSHGRTGGKILIKNNKKIAAIKRREAMIQKREKYQELLEDKTSQKLSQNLL